MGERGGLAALLHRQPLLPLSLANAFQVIALRFPLRKRCGCCAWRAVLENSSSEAGRPRESKLSESFSDGRSQEPLATLELPRRLPRRRVTAPRDIEWKQTSIRQARESSLVALSWLDKTRTKSSTRLNEATLSLLPRGTE